MLRIPENAEKLLRIKLKLLLKVTQPFFEEVGAKAVQGQAYLPGKDE